MADEQVIRAKDGGGGAHDLAAILDDAVTYAMRIKAADTDSRLDSVISELQSAITELQGLDTANTTALGNIETDIEAHKAEAHADSLDEQAAVDELKAQNLTKHDSIITELQRLGDGSQSNWVLSELGVNEEAFSPWVDTSELSSLLVFAFGLAPLATLEVQWSTDGVTPGTGLLDVSNLMTTETEAAGFYIYLDQYTTMIRRYCRLHIVNGGTAQTSGFFEADIWQYGPGSYPWTTLGLEESLSSLSLATLTRSVQAGTKPDGTFANTPLDGTLYANSFEVSGQLPSGATPSFDAVGPIVAANVIDTGWIDVTKYNYQVFHAVYDIAGVKMFLMNASDDQGNNSVTTSFAFPNGTSSGPGTSIELGAEFFDDYFRVVIINDSGNASDAWSIRSKALSKEPGAVKFSLDQPIQDFFPAPIIQAIVKGKQPDGDYESVPIAGSDPDNTSLVPLGADAVFTGGWRDTTGYTGGMLVVYSDVASATDGVCIQFSEDQVSIHREIKFTYSNLLSGEPRFFPLMQGEYYRIKYTNSSSAQSIFVLRAEIFVGQAQSPLTAIASDLDGTQLASINRSVVTGQSPSGLFENVKTDGLGRSLVTSGSEFARLLARQVENTDELRLDVEPASSDFYIGKNVDGTATSDPSWDIIKISLSATRNPNRIQFVQDAIWDNRVTEF